MRRPMVGPRVYTVEEANEQVPDLVRIFDTADGIREKMKRAKLRLNALEVIWGEKVHDEACADHGEYLHYVREMKALEEGFQKVLEDVNQLGGVVKGVEPALVDVYGVRDGRLVFLCWQRGEKTFAHWHHIDEGFAGRHPI